MSFLEYMNFKILGCQAPVPQALTQALSKKPKKFGKLLTIHTETLMYSQWKFDNSDEAQLSSIKTKVDKVYKKWLINVIYLPLHTLKKKLILPFLQNWYFLRIFTVRLHIFEYMNLAFSMIIKWLLSNKSPIGILLSWIKYLWNI